MKVILLTDIPKVGNRYDVKEFKEGYAQNVLLSKGLAELATPQALAKLEARERDMKKKKEEEVSAFEELVSQVSNTVITIEARANEKGSLFKQVSQKDVADAILKSSNVKIDESSIIVGHIKEVGTYTVKIKKGEKEGKSEVVVKDKK
jgi:large subunit ribosomal protein L9